MNETDVREIIVRPLLDRLGYRHGTLANVRTEVPLRYERAFLGRKNPIRDPPLLGRSDYVCDAIPYGRWVVEVKSPKEDITRDAVQQAHTYAAHPEIAASFFLLTNGRHFELYRTSALNEPVLKCSFTELEEKILSLYNLVSPQALQKLANLVKPDAGKPLGKGLDSRLRVLGGTVIYDEHTGTHPLLASAQITGLKLPVTGGYVQRDIEGRIHAHVQLASAFPSMTELTQSIGLGEGYDFFSIAEFLSSSIEEPAIFQNLVESTAPKGTPCDIPGLGKFPCPFQIDFAAYTEAVGFVADNSFRGTMRLDYDFSFTGVEPHVMHALQLRFGSFPSKASMRGTGRFELEFASGI